jgi:hypothetical protein
MFLILLRIVFYTTVVVITLFFYYRKLNQLTAGLQVLSAPCERESNFSIPGIFLGYAFCFFYVVLWKVVMRYVLGFLKTLLWRGGIVFFIGLLFYIIIFFFLVVVFQYFKNLGSLEFNLKQPLFCGLPFQPLM